MIQTDAGVPVFSLPCCIMPYDLPLPFLHLFRPLYSTLDTRHFSTDFICLYTSFFDDAAIYFRFFLHDTPSRYFSNWLPFSNSRSVLFLYSSFLQVHPTDLPRRIETTRSLHPHSFSTLLFDLRNSPFPDPFYSLLLLSAVSTLSHSSPTWYILMSMFNLHF